MSEIRYEWGVLRKGDRRERGHIHRERMTERQARAWVRETEDEGWGKGIFRVVRREIRAWEDA